MASEPLRLRVYLAAREFRSQTTKIPCAQVSRNAGPPRQSGIPYLTSSGNGTSSPFNGVHDPLFARAFVLDDGKQSIALLSADSIGYDNALLGAGRDFTGELRKRIVAKTDLRAENIMVASTHSHSTPETICLSNLHEVAGGEEWLEEHLQTLAETVIEAWKNRLRVKVFAGVTKVEGVARNRRILLKDGKLSRYGYTAHPVVAMLLPEVSADYPVSRKESHKQNLLRQTTGFCALPENFRKDRFARKFKR